MVCLLDCHKSDYFCARANINQGFIVYQHWQNLNQGLEPYRIVIKGVESVQIPLNWNVSDVEQGLDIIPDLHPDL